MKGQSKDKTNRWENISVMYCNNKKVKPNTADESDDGDKCNDYIRYTAVDVTFPFAFVSCQVSVKVHRSNSASP